MVEDLKGETPVEVTEIPKTGDEYVDTMAEEAVKKMIPIDHFQPPESDQLLDCPTGEIKGIVFHPDKRLKQVSEVVPEDFDADEIDQLIADMATTMYAVGGVGLSAIQIGVPLRVFICDIFANSQPDEKTGQMPSQLLVAVNPEIGWTSDEKVRLEEGCLSFPTVHEHIMRPAVIGLRGHSRKGKPFALRAGGALGRVILHEMDHLDGVTFLDRMKPMQRKMASKSMLKFHRGVRRDNIRVKR